MGSLMSLLRLNFLWPVGTVASWPFREDGIQQQLLCRSQLTLCKPCPGPSPAFSLIVKVVVAVVGPRTRDGNGPGIK